MAESDRDQLIRMSKEKSAARAEKDKQAAQTKQDESEQRAAKIKSESTLTQEIVDVLKPIFEDFPLADTNRVLRVRSETSSNIFFPDCAGDHQPKCSIAMTDTTRDRTIFVARYRGNGIVLTELIGGRQLIPNIDELKKHLMERISDYGREEVLAVLEKTNA